MNTPTPRTNRAWNAAGDDNAGAAWGLARTLERELTTEREKVRVLRDALHSLINEQNGPPLRRRRAGWQTAMDAAGLALATTDNAK